MIKMFFVVFVGFFAWSSKAMMIQVKDEMGRPISVVMVTTKTGDHFKLPTEDQGYPLPNQKIRVSPERTRFTNLQGVVQFDDSGLRDVSSLRFRKIGYQDHKVRIQDLKGSVILKSNLTEEETSLQQPANVWMDAIRFSNPDDRLVFKMQCGFCHQQATSFFRVDRSKEEWNSIIKRMIGYGSRLPTSLQKTLPELMAGEMSRLKSDPKSIGRSKTLSDDVSNYEITEWPVGDAMSQTHDMLFAKNGLVYVVDNIQDRLWEVNPFTNEISVYKIPHRQGEENGGLISARLKTFPRHDSTSNAHSLAESEKDGHLFITPSAQRRLVEFDPEKKEFILHEMEQGFYPHTIRTDQKDRVWFTLALSNQVAMFDRVQKKFTYYDLPSRNLKEKILTRYIHFVFKVMNWGISLSQWLPIDRQFIGTPLVYGIEVTPNQKVWFARLHTKEIGMIDPESGKIQMIPTPFEGPRRLRADAKGNLWIAAFPESKVAKYTPETGEFKLFELPVVPVGSDTPYSLNVDRKRDVLWVNGNQSDQLHRMDLKTEQWISIPFPRRTTFTRDVEFDPEGNAYTSNSNFPSWHVEGAQPTLLRIRKISKGSTQKLGVKLK